MTKSPLSVRVEKDLRASLNRPGKNTTSVTERLLWQGLLWREQRGDVLPDENAVDETAPKDPLSIRIQKELRAEIDKIDKLRRSSNVTAVVERLLRQGYAWCDEFGDVLPEEEKEAVGLDVEVQRLRGEVEHLKEERDRQQTTIDELRAALELVAEKVDALEKPEPVAA